jgi:hypothetical protein
MTMGAAIPAGVFWVTLKTSSKEASSKKQTWPLKASTEPYTHGVATDLA